MQPKQKRMASRSNSKRIQVQPREVNGDMETENIIAAANVVLKLGEEKQPIKKRRSGN